MQTAVTHQIRNIKKRLSSCSVLCRTVFVFSKRGCRGAQIINHALTTPKDCLLRIELDQPGRLVNRYKTFVILILLSLMEETHVNLKHCFHLSWHKFLPTLYAYISKKNKTSNIMQLQNTFQVYKFAYLVIHKYFRFFVTFDFQYTLPLCQRCLRVFPRCLEIGFLLLRFCVPSFFGSVFLLSNFLRIIMSSVLGNT